jgi:hypothetical protein
MKGHCMKGNYTMSSLIIQAMIRKCLKTESKNMILKSELTITFNQ